MKKAKNIKRLITGVLSLVFCVTALTSVGQSKTFASDYQSHPDGGLKTEVFYDRFDGDLKTEWTVKDSQIEIENYALHFTKNYSWGNCLVLNAVKLTDYTKITFDMQATSYQNGDFSICFGGKTTATKMDEYDFRLIVQNDNLVVNKLEPNANGSYVGSTANPIGSKILKRGEKVNFELILQTTSSETCELKVKITGASGQLANHVFSDIPYLVQNGYLSMFNANLECDITNFKVYSEKTALQPTFTDDFSVDKITESYTQASQGNWHINTNILTKKDYYTCKLAVLNLSKANSYAINTIKLEKDIRVTNSYQLNLEAYLQSLSSGLYYGVGFGLANVSDAIDKNAFIGFTKKSNDTASLALVKNGTVIEQVDIPTATLNVGVRSAEITLLLKSNNSVEIKVGTFSKIFNNVLTNGMFALGSVSNPAHSDAIEDGVFTIKQISLTQSKYQSENAPDVSNDFNGTYMTDDGYEETYINTQRYYLGSGVELKPKTAWESSNGISFTSTDTGSCFGYKAEYSDFVLQFDVVINTAFRDQSMFGISFGKSTIGSTYINSQSISFIRDQWGVPRTDENYISLWNCTDSEGRTASTFTQNGYGEYDFYKDTQTKYNFMFVAKNRSVSVYFKEDGEPISQLGKRRLLIDNVNTSGYVTVFAGGGLSIDISNFKLANIAPDATGKSAISLREDFSGELSSEIALTGGKVENGKAVLTDGKLEIAKDRNFFISQFAVSSVTNNYSFNFGDYQLKFIPSENKAQLIYNGEVVKTLKSPVGTTSMSSLNNKNLQITVIDNRVMVGARSDGDPYDKFSELIINEVLDVAPTSGKISITCEGKMGIDQLKVYALDNTYLAQTINEADDPQNLSLWEVLPDDPNAIGQPQEQEKAGCQGAINTSYFALLGATALAVILNKKRNGDKGV